MPRAPGSSVRTRVRTREETGVHRRTPHVCFRETPRLSGALGALYFMTVLSAFLGLSASVARRPPPRSRPSATRAGRRAGDAVPTTEGLGRRGTREGGRAAGGIGREGGRTESEGLNYASDLWDAVVLPILVPDCWCFTCHCHV